MEVAIELILYQTLLYNSGLVGAASSDLEIVSQDTISAFPCNWSIITFECTINGGKRSIGSTVWTGTAFSGCDIKEIVLLHNRFEASTSSYHQCNDINGDITLNSQKNIRVENNSYYNSQLEVIVKPDPGINNEIIMKTIECIHDNGTHTMLVGSMTINVPVICSNTTLTLKEETQDSNIKLTIIIISVALVFLFILILSIVSLLLYGLSKKFRSTLGPAHDTSGRVPREKSKCQVVSYDEVGSHVEIVKSFDTETMGIYLSLSDLTPDDSFAVQKGDNIAKGETLSCDLTYNLVYTLGGQVSSKWYSFGLAIGVPKQVLNQLKHDSDEECLVEVLDYWIRHHPTGKPMWEEVMEAKNRIVSDTA